MQNEFDLKEALAEWRVRMLANLDPTVVEELERHLMDSFESHLRANEIPSAAFAKAQADFGEPESLKNEFSKFPATPFVNRKVIAALFVSVSALNLIAFVGERVMPFSNEIMPWSEVGQRILSANPLQVLFDSDPGVAFWLACYLIVMLRYLNVRATRGTRLICCFVAIVGPVIQLWMGQGLDGLLSAFVLCLFATIGAPFFTFYIGVVGVDGEFFTDAEATLIALGWWGLLWWILLLRECNTWRWIGAIREAIRSRMAT